MSYRNPLPIFSAGGLSRESITCNPDPFAIKYKGKYYCYSSGERGVAVLRSDGLQNFTHCGYAYREEDEHSYWAPAVLYWNGTFYLYYSSLANGRTEDHEHFLKIAVSRDPLGPFRFERILISHFAIDPHVVRSGGKMYLFYSENVDRNPETGRIGTAIKMTGMESPLILRDDTRTVLLPTFDEEIFSRNRFGDGKDWHTLEGAFYLEDGRTRYLMYSGNAYTSEDYFIGYATASMSVPLEEAIFTKYPDDDTYFPLVRGCGFLVGTGHNSVVKAPDNVTDVMVYHGKILGEKSGKETDGRRICADILRERGGMLLTKAPTSGPQPDLPQPDFKACFTGGEIPCVRSSGEWSLENEELKGKGTGRVVFTSELGGNYYLEAWIFIEGGNAGFLLQSGLPEEGVQIGADLKTGSICISRFRNGRGTRSDIPVRGRPEPSCYHKFSIRWSSGVINFCIDEEEQINLSEGKALTSAGCYVADGEMKVATFEMTRLN